MVKKLRSSSGRVKMTIMAESGATRTSIACLTRIRKDRLEAERKLLEDAAKVRRLQEHLTEAQLEVGDFSQETEDGITWNYDFDDQTSGMQTMEDDDDHGDDDQEELPSAFSKYFTPGMRINGTTRRYDKRTRLQRNERTHKAWEDQLTVLVDQYLAWKHGNNAAMQVDEDAYHVFHVDSIGVFDYAPHLPVMQREDELANAALIRAGLLGCSPLQPVVAIKLECLEFYHQLRRRQSSFSVQAMVKVLCALHNTSYTRHLRSQFAAAFDAYLAIKRRIQLTLRQALNRHGLAWRLGRSCPPCSFQLSDELALSPARLHTMDGNFSAKRLDGPGSADPRVFQSDYFVPITDIERFHNDAPKKPGDAASARPETCTSNWSAAKAAEEDKVHVFEQTGIFVLACRHGFVECIAEMKRSGELAKYGLSVINQILDFCDRDQAVGHDIGCASKVTVANSVLGERAKEAGLRVVVNAFHGFAHNRLCQLQNHPLYQQGFGTEDLETCERIFSSSNSTAPLIRHASLFHWKQFLDLHFDQWDSDKYLELTRFLYNNYKQALDLIKKYTTELVNFRALTNFGEKDFENWHQEELEYLKNCASEPTVTSVSVVYVEELQKLQYVEKTYAATTASPYLTYMPSNFTPGSGLSQITRQCSNAVSAEFTSARRKYELQLNVVEHFERTHGIQTRWTPDDAEYIAVQDYAKHRTFIRVIEELEGLVVKRLFELSKANLAGTGYKMRKHISKALTRRSAAIRAALERYNKLAPRQKPPRPKLEYCDVIGYTALGEFSLLKMSRHDVLTKPWTKPANREMSMKYFKLLRSKEEITRLNLEVRRLATWVDHDEKQIAEAIQKFQDAGSEGLAAEMGLLYAERHRVNDIHRNMLNKIYKLEGYSGQRSECRTPDEGSRKQGSGDRDEDDEEEDDDDEEVVAEVVHLTDCLDRIN